VETRKDPDQEELESAPKLVIPFSPNVIAQKGITREPASNGQLDAIGREKLLNAIRRASAWVEAVRSGESFEARQSPFKKASVSATFGGWRYSRSFLLTF